eukprot:TRINITY_DN17887_c0_g3_i2.p1 TRINITY_DN17887_c0_g3~~TRINITY_DN17887_c0_g3_i2.p1  ORF type:complete len:488 (+),score=135.88 TRINITY_DN17887_c0_g3_i2:135-1598(+)
MDETWEMFESHVGGVADPDVVSQLVELVQSESGSATEQDYQRVAVNINNHWRSGAPDVRMGLLQLMHDLSDAVRSLTSILSPLIPPRVAELLESGDVPSEAVWKMVNAWNLSLLPTEVSDDLQKLKEEGLNPIKRTAAQMESADYSAAKRIRLTDNALRIFNTDNEHAQEVDYRDEEKMEKGMMRKSAARVIQWLRGGGTHQSIGRLDELIPAAKELPVSWKVDQSSVVTFMEKLTARITEVLVDHPQLRDLIGEVLAHTTTVQGNVEKAKRLQDFQMLLGKVSGGCMDVPQFENELRKLLPSAEQQAAADAVTAAAEGAKGAPADAEDDIIVADSAEGEGEAVESEYDPFAALDEDMQEPLPSAEDMNAKAMHYLPPFKGQASSFTTPPSLGPLHVLSRVHYLHPDQWMSWGGDHTQCQPLRVFLVRREPKPTAEELERQKKEEEDAERQREQAEQESQRQMQMQMELQQPDEDQEIPEELLKFEG